MIQKIKTLMLSLALVMAPALAAGFVVTPAYAEVNIGANVCQGADIEIDAQDGGANCDEDVNAGGVNNLLRQIVNIISAIVGVIAVIMIVVGGFKYITSGGDSNKVSSAKNTIIYAIIGLIIVALAQVIVRFVLSQTSNAVA